MDVLRGWVAALRDNIVSHPRIWSVIGVGFLFRLIWLLYAQPEPISDFNDYRTLAFDLIDHGQFGYPESTAFFLPAHPWYLAAFALVARSAVWLGFSTVLLSTAAIGLLYLVAREIFDDELRPLIAAGAAAVFPTFVFFSPVLATEHLFVVLMLLAVLMALKVADRPPVRALAAGGFLGLAALTRGEAIFYGPVILLIIWFSAGVADRSRRLVLWGLMLAGSFAVVFPWVVRNQVVVGSFGLSSTSGINFYNAHNDTGFYGVARPSALAGLDAEAASDLGWELGLEYLRDDPLSLIRNLRPGTIEYFRDPNYALVFSTRDEKENPRDETYPVKDIRLLGVSGIALRVGATAALALAAASLLAWRSWPRRLWLVVVPLVATSWFLRTVIYWAQPRYRYFTDVLLLLLVAVAVAQLVRRPAAEPVAPAAGAAR